jgi:hypothetical protein
VVLSFFNEALIDNCKDLTLFPTKRTFCPTEVSARLKLAEYYNEVRRESARMQRIYLCCDEQLVSDAPVLRPFADELFRALILAMKRIKT